MRSTAEYMSWKGRKRNKQSVVPPKRVAQPIWSKPANTESDVLHSYEYHICEFLVYGLDAGSVVLPAEWALPRQGM